MLAASRSSVAVASASDAAVSRARTNAASAAARSASNLLDHRMCEYQLSIPYPNYDPTNNVLSQRIE
jgi:hypothetical protein